MKCQICKKYISFARINKDGKYACEKCYEPWATIDTVLTAEDLKNV